MRRKTKPKIKQGIPLCVLALLLLGACRTSPNPKVEIQTAEGVITVELYPNKAPVTTANFMKLVTQNAYKRGKFYRVVHPHNQAQNPVKIEVIQGGLFEDSLINQWPSIAHETTAQTGILHKNGVISMARLAPGTASTELFICIGDQPALDFGGNRNPDGQGFAAFGRVIKGMEIVRKIQQMPEANQYLTTPIPFQIKISSP